MNKLIQIPDLNIGNVRKLDQRMSTLEDFPRRGEPPRLRYLMCSTARCGSTLVADLLHGTGAAGLPEEYLNRRQMAAWLRARGGGHRLDLAEYLRDIEARRTSPNGVFGIKVHFEHMVGLWRDDSAGADAFLRRFGRVLLLTRRDKLAQAVSLHKARVTQVWSSRDREFMAPDDPRRNRKAVYDAPGIARALSDIVAQETGWRRTLTRLNIPHTEVVHEDFLADMDGWMARLRDELGLGPDVRWSAPRIEKQGSGDDPMIGRFRVDLGLDRQGASGDVSR